MIGLLQTNILRPADVNFQGLVHVYLGCFSEVVMPGLITD